MDNTEITGHQSNMWFYFSIIISFVFFAHQYLKYLSNKDHLIQKEAKLKIKT